jgi:hypothetical protein
MRDDLERPIRFREVLSGYGLHLAASDLEAPLLVIDNFSKMPTAN